MSFSSTPPSSCQTQLELTPEQLTRYSRHLILPEIGMEGQKKLLRAKVLIIGAGGLGSPLALYLSAAGVGTLGLVDFDNVDLSNLQRQILHTQDEIGKPKLDSAERRIKGMNPDTRVIKFPTKISSENAFDIIRNFDMVIDGTDNFPTRYLVNDACYLLGKTNIYGSIFRFDGQATVFSARGGSAFGGQLPEGPCYRCLYPEPPPPGMVPSCAEGGVLGILPGIIGVIQATEAVKIITGQGASLVGRLLIYDALQMTFRQLKLRRDPACPLCGVNPSIKQLIDYQEFCGLTKPSSVVGREPSNAKEVLPVISAKELKEKMDRKDKFLLVDVREVFEYNIAKIPGSVLIPLGELPNRFEELRAHEHEEIVVHCRSGGRSQRAIDFLATQGFSGLRNLTGGITAWSDDVDPSVPKY
ncbi:MAG: molybdopterin-synthase adenylyltransferase MoeB [Candidatus Omnitrophica bacterium]|nr:molybdopterin-synthase adenylyltransferase MoeB [Candidatus Omnitrophota bacterium]